MTGVRPFSLAQLERLWARAEAARLTTDANAGALYELVCTEIARLLRSGDQLVDYQELVGLLTAATEARRALRLQVGRWPASANAHGPASKGKPASGTVEAAAPLPIIGFIHVAAVNAWRALWDQLRDRLMSSGLWARTARLYVGWLGSDDETLAWDDPRVEFIAHGSKVDAHEIPTLSALWNWSQEQEALVLYLHTKGVVSERQYPPVADWRELMLQVVVDRHPDCVALLDRFDVCGANWHLRPWRHFSGNFWWARTDYLRRLPSPAVLPADEDRTWAERWIGSDPAVRAASLHESAVNHYHTAYPVRLAISPPIRTVSSEAPWARESAWRGLENAFQEHLTAVQPVSVVVEIGVEYGHSLFSLATAFPEAAVFGVDPYAGLPESGLNPSPGPLGTAAGESAEAWVRRWLPEFPRVRLLKATSSAAAARFEYSIDVLHIDAVHVYEQVAQDFALWEPKVRPGGCVLFHDTRSFPDDVGRFFRELAGRKVEIPHSNGLGIWFKPLGTPRSFRSPHVTTVPGMASEPVLSVLIPSLHKRRALLRRLRQSLERQIVDHGLAGQVEVLTLVDAGEVPVGTKRNVLQARAGGRYVVFIDDDDEVDGQYLPILCRILRENPEIDCVGFLGEMTWSGRTPEPTIYSLRYREPGQLGTRPGYRVHLRSPQHVNPLLRQIAIRYPFPELRCGEDAVRAADLVRDRALRREYFYGQRYLYRYCFDPAQTATQQRAATADSRRLEA